MPGAEEVILTWLGKNCWPHTFQVATALVMQKKAHVLTIRLCSLFLSIHWCKKKQSGHTALYYMYSQWLYAQTREESFSNKSFSDVIFIAKSKLMFENDGLLRILPWESRIAHCIATYKELSLWTRHITVNSTMHVHVDCMHMHAYNFTVLAVVYYVFYNFCDFFGQ